MVQLAAHAKSSTLYGRSYGRTSKFFRLDGLLLFCIIMGLRSACSASIQLFSLQFWYKIQKSNDENSSINQHEGVILIWHQLLVNTLKQMEGRLTNHILAVRGSTLWNTLQSQNLSLITTNLNSYCHEAFVRFFRWANFVELNRTPNNKLFSVSVAKPTS